VKDKAENHGPSVGLQGQRKRLPRLVNSQENKEHSYLLPDHLLRSAGAFTCAKVYNAKIA